MVNEIILAGGLVTCIPAKNNVQLMLKCADVVAYIRKHDINIVHAHLPWAGIVARVAGRISGVPVIYTEHNKLERYHYGTRIMNLMTMNLLRIVIAVSEEVAKSLQRYKPNLKPALRTILNGVNIDDFRRDQVDGKTIRRTLGIPDGAIIFGNVAVYRDQKRLDIWLEVAGSILAQFPDVHFLLVGDGPLNATLREKRDSLGLAERVHMTGLQTEVRPYLAAMDIFMMTSKFEGLPIALLEAMAIGCAIISTNAGGIGQVIRHDVDGLVCPVEEPMQLTKFASRLISDSEAMNRFKQSARTRVVSDFSLSRMVSALEEIYLSFSHSK